MKKILMAILILLLCGSAYAAGKYTVQGAVRLANGAPAAGLTVKLFQRQGKAGHSLGSAITSQNGSYQITYAPRSSLKGVTIYIRVLNKNGKRLYKSPPIRRARPSEVINVRLP